MWPTRLTVVFAALVVGGLGGAVLDVPGSVPAGLAIGLVLALCYLALRGTHMSAGRILIVCGAIGVLSVVVLNLVELRSDQDSSDAVLGRSLLGTVAVVLGLAAIHAAASLPSHPGDDE